MTTKTRKPAKAATPKAAPEQGPDFDLATVGIAKLIARLRWLEADCRYKADLSDVFGHAAQRRTRSNLAKIEKYELQARSTRELAQIAASFAASAQIASSCFEFPMKLVPIALLIFVAPAFAEELPINRAATICKPGWTKAVRPPFRVMDRIKRDKLRAAGWTEADNDRFELDYVIPLSLGGAPDDPNNFQLEPGNEVVEKEALEACLPRLVCERRLMLDEARKAVWRDWRAALGLCRD